jgi:transcriptional regulator with XRE-family HTH domain
MTISRSKCLERRRLAGALRREQGRRLRLACKAAGLAPEQLGQAIGVSPHSILGREAGRTALRVIDAVLLSPQLGVSPQHLLAIDGGSAAGLRVDPAPVDMALLARAAQLLGCTLHADQRDSDVEFTLKPREAANDEADQSGPVQKLAAGDGEGGAHGGRVRPGRSVLDADRARAAGGALPGPGRAIRGDGGGG